MPCKAMGIGHEGKCVFGVVPSFWPRNSNDRYFAMGVLDSEKAFLSASKEAKELVDQSVGRLQMILVDSLKDKLLLYLEQNYKEESRISREFAIEDEIDIEGEKRDELDSNEFDSLDSFDNSPRDSFEPDAEESQYSPIDRSMWLHSRQEEILQKVREMQLQIQAMAAKFRSNKKELGEPEEEAKTIHFILNGWTGKVQVDKCSLLTLDSFKTGLDPIPKEISDKYSEEARRKKKYQSVDYGTARAWLPHGTKIVATSQLKQKSNHKEVHEAIIDIFSRG